MWKKTTYLQVGAAKSKRKAIKFRNKPWALKQKQKVNSKIGEQIMKSLYNQIMHHPQVLQSPIINNCLKMKIDGHTEPKPVPKLLLQVFFRELHNNLVSNTDNSWPKEARYAENNIIISDSTLSSLLPPQ